MSDDPRLTQVAETVLGQVLALRQGESVCVVRDSEATAALADAIVRVARRIGAEPVSVTMVPRSVGGEELPDPLAGALVRSSAVVNLSRWALEHTRGATEALRSGVRIGDLRGLIEERVLESPGLTTDYEVVRRNALAMDALLEKAREVHVTAPEGTDLTLQLCGRKGKAQTGFATEPGQFSGLPDGESTVAPLEGTTQGRIVNPYVMEKIGLIDEPFLMEIRDGWIVNVEGGKQARQLLDLLDRSDPNARRIASQFAVGMNPDCRIFSNMRETSKRLGTIHVALGDNITLGGTVQSGLHIDIVVLNAIITLDGKEVLKDSQLYI